MARSTGLRQSGRRAIQLFSWLRLYPRRLTTHKKTDEVDNPTGLQLRRLYLLDVGLGNDPAEADQGGRILVGSPDGRGQLQPILQGQKLPDSLALYGAGRIMWTNMGTLGKNDGCVMSCDLQGHDIRFIVPPGVTHTPKQLAIEKKTQKLYFCDREGMRIMRCNLDGSNLETLVDTGSRKDGFTGETEQQRWCVGIALAPAEQKFYWSQKGPSKGFQGQIFRAHMHMPTGQTAATRNDIERLVSGLPEPIHLEVDEENLALYWTDRGELPMGNTLNRAWLSSIGTQGYDVLARNLHEAMGLAIDKINGHVYVTDLGGTVYRFDRDGKNKRKVYDCEGIAFTGITIQ